jgi:hypothetical protein
MLSCSEYNVVLDKRAAAIILTGMLAAGASRAATACPETGLSGADGSARAAGPCDAPSACACGGGAPNSPGSLNRMVLRRQRTLY